MIRARHNIVLREGVTADVLFTPSLYAIAQERGVTLEIDPTDSQTKVMRVYLSLIYLGALNAWEAKLFDHPELGAFPYEFIDFEEWAGTNPRAFVDMIDTVLQCLTGKTLRQVGQDEQDKLKKK